MKQDIYKKCLNHLHSYDDTWEFLSQLRKDSESYHDAILSFNVERYEPPVFRGKTPPSPVVELLTLLDKTKVRQWQSLGYCCFHLYRNKKLSEAQLVTMLKLLLNIAVRFKILSQRFNVIEKDIPKLANSLFTAHGNKAKLASEYAKAVKALKNIILKNVPDKEISAVLKNDYQFTDNDLAFVTLRIIASKKYGEHGKKWSEKLTLEHVLPIKHKKHWKNVANADSLKYNLGNLLLVVLEKNTELANKSFKDKKAIYNRLKVVDFVDNAKLKYAKANQETWCKQFIPKRTEDLTGQLIASLSIK